MEHFHRKFQNERSNGTRDYANNFREKTDKLKYRKEEQVN